MTVGSGAVLAGLIVGLGAEELPEPGARPATCAVGVDGEL
jgi:NAD(P)H-hydrate repair Nnr-like enzyme with NAD(P)H-hydrate dehydratase domain